MKPSARQQSAGAHSVPPGCIAEAGVWIARLHGDDRDQAIEAGFREWLAADPQNRRAFELATEVWEESANLRRVVPFAHDATKPVRARRPRILSWPAALTAATAIVIVLTLGGVIRYLEQGSVATGVGEQRLLSLQDGTRVFLNTSTRVRVRYEAAERRVQLLAGEALFDVRPDKRRPFVVVAGDQRVTALGTSFVVRLENEKTAVTLVEGKVSVSGDARAAASLPPVTLSPGQRLTLTPSEPAALDRPALESALAWRHGEIILDDTPLARAAEEMNRYSSMRIEIERPETEALLVSGLFQTGDSLSFANAVAQTYGLRVVQRDAHIVIEGLPLSDASKTPPARAF
jgi:transmembrane sensor